MKKACFSFQIPPTLKQESHVQPSFIYLNHFLAEQLQLEHKIEVVNLIIECFWRSGETMPGVNMQHAHASTSCCLGNQAGQF